jgi:hypothetical protein
MLPLGIQRTFAPLGGGGVELGGAEHRRRLLSRFPVTTSPLLLLHRHLDDLACEGLGILFVIQ